ncbi:MAG TPA: hypothetical protein VFV99_16975 [Kofleriaceae bacterium]|nr:hypothetical protein [Kofleriaceae bacterium]
MSSEIFRDPTEGVNARRADLLRRRRDELVMMPHAIRRVYVARRARTAASVAIAFVGTALLAVAAKPAWAAYLAKGLPGINPAVLCTGIVAMWLVGLFTYFAARAVDEHRFAVAMSKLVMPGKDVNADVERLSHENPDQAARDMAHRLEVRSSAWPVIAAAVLVPVTALYAAAIYRAGGWPVIAEFEASVAVHAKALLACAGVGTLIAFAMTKRTMRLPIVGPMMMGLAIATSAGALFSLWLVPIALILATVALVVRRLRIERDLLQAEDPAAGSEIWTIRGFIRQLRQAGGAAIARVRKIRRRRLVIGGVAAVAAVAGALVLVPAKPARVTTQVKVATANQKVVTATVVTEPTGSKSMVEIHAMNDGRVGLRITLDIADDLPVSVPSLAGMANVPPMWNATVRITQIEGLGLVVSPFGGSEDMKNISVGEAITVTHANCGMGESPFGFRAQGAPGHYVLFVEPTLAPVGC